MSFWSALGNILRSPAARNIASAVGPMLAGAAESAASNRGAREQAQLTRDQIALLATQAREAALRDRARLDMERREFAQKSQSDAYRKALAAAYLGGWTPAERPAGIPMVRGGFNTIPASARGAAQELERQALLRLMEGEQFDPLPEIERFTPTPAPRASIWERLSGLLGPGLTAFGEYRRLRDGSPINVGDRLPLPTMPRIRG